MAAPPQPEVRQRDLIRSTVQLTDAQSQAVLFRSSSHSGSLEVELTRRTIPFVKFGGLKFLDSAHVKDLLAVLRFAQNPRDRVAGFRLLQMLPGIGPQTAGKIIDTIAADPEPLQSLAEIPPPPKSGDDWPALVTLLSALREADTGWPGEMALARNWYEPQLERIHEDADTRKPIFCSSSKLPAVIPAASASSPN